MDFSNCMKWADSVVPILDVRVIGEGTTLATKFTVNPTLTNISTLDLTIRRI
jgi:hypothetical protein